MVSNSVSPQIPIDKLTTSSMQVGPDRLRETENSLDLCAHEGRTRIAYLRTSLRGLQESWLTPSALHFQQDCHEALDRSERVLQAAHTLALRISRFRQRIEAAEH